MVGSVVETSALGWSERTDLADFCDILEFRADGMTEDLPAVQRAMQNCRVPVLLTVRAAAEGGCRDLPTAERIRIFLSVLPLADLVDVEISGLEECAEVVQEAKRQEIPTVASYHDFSGTPELVVLESLAHRAAAAGAAAVKFATTLKGSRDLAVLMALQESLPRPCATMGMGPLGRVSRLVLAQLGSVLNYGYLDRATVPGQWAAGRLKECLQELRS